MTFTVVVRNTSTVDSVTIDTLTDDIHGDLAGQGTCAVPQVIAAGGSSSCTFNAAVTGNAGATETDTVTASGTDDDRDPVSASGSATVTITDTPSSLAVTKTANPTSLPEPGGSVLFTLVVRNTSAVDSITVTSLVDDVHGDVTNVAGTITATTCLVPPWTIAAGGSSSCTFTATVTGNAGASETDTVTASGTDDDRNPVSASGSATVTFTDVKPTMTITKTADPATLPEPGGPVAFTLLVQNTAPEAIVLTSARDDVYGDLNGKGDCVLPYTIVAGGSFTCTATGPVTGDAGDRRTDTITAIAQDDDGNTVTEDAEATVEITNVDPSISAAKRAEPIELPEPGGPVAFTIRVENPSPVEDVVLTSLVDDVYGDVTVAPSTCKLPQTLTKSGGTYTCSFSRMVNGDAGEVKTDTITASAADNEGNRDEATASASVTITNVEPRLSVQKSAVPASLPEPGGAFDIVITVTNGSAVDPLTLTSLTDSIEGDLDGVGTCDLAPPVTIQPLGAYSCTFSSSLTGNAGDSESDTVTAVATSDDPDDKLVTASDGATFTITDVPPSFEIEKSASPSTITEPGADVTFTVKITNSGPEPLTLTSLVDDNYGNLDGQGTCDLTPPVVPPAVVIPVGDSYDCSFVRFVANDAGETKVDIVTATLTDDDGNSVTKSDSASVFTENAPPVISLEKSLIYPTTLPEPGGAAWFRVVVRNDGKEPVTITSLDDEVNASPGANLDGNGSCSVPQTIPPGGFYACSFEQSVKGTAGDTVSDTVTATATDNDPGSGPVQADSNEVAIEIDKPSSGTGDPPTLTVTKTATPSSIPEPGGPVTYTVVVTNTSPEKAFLTLLFDDIYGNLDGLIGSDCRLPQGPLAPTDPSTEDDTYTCSFPGTVTGEAGEVESDQVFAVLTDGEGESGLGIGREDVDITDVEPSITMTKTPSPATVAEPGGTVWFSVVVRNPSPEPVTITSLVDSVDAGLLRDLSGQGSCVTPQTIPAGAAYTCSFPSTVNGNAGTRARDTVTATFQDDDGNTGSETASASVEITASAPSLSVVKTASPASVPEPGGEVTYTVTITNTSDATDPVTITSLTDSVEGGPSTKPADLACTVAGDPVVVEFTLTASQSAICTFAGRVVGNAEDATSDTFTASGVDDERTAATGRGSETVAVTDVLPTLEVAKTASPNPIPEPGGPVAYTATVRNTSPEEVTLAYLYDDVAGNLDGLGTCDLTPAVAIPVGGRYECSWPGRVSGDVGDVRSNVLTARVRDDEGNTASATVQADVLISNVDPVFRVLKTAAPATMPEPGGPVTFTVTLINDSRENVTIDSFVDVPYGNLNGKGTCRLPQTLTPNGGFYTCTFRETVTGTALLSPYTDTVTAKVSDNDGNQVTGSAQAQVVLTDVKPSITVAKTATPPSLPEPGGSFDFGLVVTNTSVEPVTLTSLEDDIYGDVTKGAGLITATTCSLPQTLAPADPSSIADTYTCSFSVSFTGNPKSQRDVVTASARDDENNVTTASDDATITITDVRPSIGVTKTPNPASLPEPGGPVAFTFTVTNRSTVDPLTITSLTDTVFGTLAGDADCRVGTVLPPGATCDFAQTFAVTGSAATGPHSDIFRARGRDDDTPATVTATATATVTFTDVLPSITVAKTATPLTLPEPGGPFTFSITVTNTSVEPVTLQSLVDVPYGDITRVAGRITATTCAVPRAIGVGGSYSCSFTGTFTGNAGASQTDTVTATARDDEGNPATASDDAVVRLTDVLPTMSVTKTPVPTSLPEPGGPVAFTFTVTNGSVVDPLTITSLSDTDFTLLGDADCQVGTVLPPGPGAAATCSFTQTYPLSGSTATGPHEDTFTATGRDDEGNPTSASADATVTFTDVQPSITITKILSPRACPSRAGTSPSTSSSATPRWSR